MSPPPATPRISPRLLLGLVLAIVIDTAVQVMWKKAAVGLPPFQPPLDHFLMGVIATVLTSPVFIIVGILIAAQMINWIKTLDHADVSFAQPITALSYISVALVSRLWFGEAITFGRVAGMALILTGVWFVTRSDPNTTGHDSQGEAQS